MLRNQLHNSAQQTNFSLERLESNLRVLLVEPEEFAIRVGFRYIMNDLQHIEECNNICLTNLRRLRDSLRRRIETMNASNNAGSISHDRNSFQTFINTLNEVIETLNTLERQLTNTGSRIRSIKFEILDSSLFNLRFRQSASNSAGPSSTPDVEQTSSTTPEQLTNREPRFYVPNVPVRLAVRRELDVESNDNDQPPTSRRRLNNDHNQANEAPGITSM